MPKSRHRSFSPSAIFQDSKKDFAPKRIAYFCKILWAPRHSKNSLIRSHGAVVANDDDNGSKLVLNFIPMTMPVTVGSRTLEIFKIFTPVGVLLSLLWEMATTLCSVQMDPFVRNTCHTRHITTFQYSIHICPQPLSLSPFLKVTHILSFSNSHMQPMLYQF